MEDQFAGKIVPWSQMEEYLETHKKTIVAFLDLKDRKVMKVPDIEANLPNSFYQLHELITRILKNNNILGKEEDSKADKLELIVKTVLKI
jgi:hypothetical protein